MRRRRAGREESESRMTVEVGTAQWIGTRPAQNDVVTVISQGDGRGTCVMMADGIGVDSAAGAAAQAAVQAMQQTYGGLRPGEAMTAQMVRMVGAAHRAVLRLNSAALDQGRMSTGASVCAMLARGSSFHFASAGNVRIFLFRQGTLLQLNRDFLLSTEAETQGILEGEDPPMDPDWNLRVTAYAGMEGLKEVDWPGEEITLLPGDQILMMSSGLFGLLSEEEWSDILETNAPQAAADEAIARVRRMRMESQSNVTAAILRFA